MVTMCLPRLWACWVCGQGLASYLTSFIVIVNEKKEKKSTATRQVGHVCLAPAGGPRARDGHHVSAWAQTQQAQSLGRHMVTIPSLRAPRRG